MTEHLTSYRVVRYLSGVDRRGSFAERAAHIRGLAADVVGALDRLREFRSAHDRIGDKHAHKARREAVDALVRLLREAVALARTR
jgi:hypothetical protein